MLFADRTEIPDGLYHAARAHLEQGHTQEALTVLDTLLLRYPAYGPGYATRGLVQRELGDSAGAIRSFRMAASLDPTSADLWGLITELSISLGDENSTQESIKHYMAIAGRPTERTRIRAAFRSGRINEAETQCRSYLKEVPLDAEALHLLAEIGLVRGAYVDAEQLLVRSLKLMPQLALARATYSHLLMKLGNLAEAYQEATTVVNAYPNETAFRALRGSILVRIGRSDEAIVDYEALVRSPNCVAADFSSFGHALKTVGRQAEAISAYRSAITREPLYGDAYWSLANLKTFKFSDNDVHAMQSAVVNADCPKKEIPAFYFALGKAYEDLGRFDESFEYYQHGNVARRRTVLYNAQLNTQRTREMIECCGPEVFQDASKMGCQNNAPIFIVGLPRSGSTLVEQILASHSQVEGTGELPDIINIARQLGFQKSKQCRSIYPPGLSTISPERRLQLAQQYLNRANVQRGEAPYFIDKMPNNFSHIGLIHLLLPRAKIIDVRRHPMGACFGAYKQLFAVGQNFSYDLVELGQYYRDYLALMEHWDRVLPGYIHHINYEDMVGDTEATVRQLLQFCSLPFEYRCLRHWETKRAVRTASSEQVRQPIYSHATDQWKRFSKHLSPLATALRMPLDATSYA